MKLTKIKLKSYQCEFRILQCKKDRSEEFPMKAIHRESFPAPFRQSLWFVGSKRCVQHRASLLCAEWLQSLSHEKVFEAKKIYDLQLGILAGAGAAQTRVKMQRITTNFMLLALLIYIFNVNAMGKEGELKSFVSK